MSRRQRPTLRHTYHKLSAPNAHINVPRITFLGFHSLGRADSPSSAITVFRCTWRMFRLPFVLSCHRVAPDQGESCHWGHLKLDTEWVLPPVARSQTVPRPRLVFPCKLTVKHSVAFDHVTPPCIANSIAGDTFRHGLHSLDEQCYSQCKLPNGGRPQCRSPALVSPLPPMNITRLQNVNARLSF
jgi:hypothetical protein